MTSLTLDILTTFKTFVQDNDVQVQAIQIFLKIASSSGSPSMDELIKGTGVGLSAVSRNIKKLAVGIEETPGYGLITVTLDPFDDRRRVFSLSHRGQELVSRLDKAAHPHLHYITKKGCA